MTITTKEITVSFGAQISAMPGGERLNDCFACGACSGVCPVSQAIPEFDPRKIIHMIRMGLKERVLHSEIIWYCSRCKSCVFVCPQDVRFADIMETLREVALDEGYITDQDLITRGKSAWVEQTQCVSCLTCLRVCPWRIPKIGANGFAQIGPRECRACGICVGECPAQAIKLNQSEDDRKLAACGAGQ